ncbi:MAG TPA: ROK family protein [Symbiobacteriaceae bacterium]|jgi:glucokinase
MHYVAGVDLGATKIIAAIGDAEGNVLARAQTDTLAHEGSDAGVRRIARLIEQVAFVAGVDARKASAIGVGSPGPLDIKRGMILDAPNMKWKDVPLRDLLEAHFGVPVAVTNDCKAGGLGEHRFGSGQGTREMVYLGVGTGIGGCIIQNGQVVYGSTGNAGEIGHVVIDLAGPRCGCGAQGCLESISSGSGIGRAGQEAARTPEGGFLRDLAGGAPDQVHGGTVAQAAAAGDAAARAILSRAAKALGVACSNLMNLLGPEVVVLGGGVMAKNGPAFLAEIEAEAKKQVLAGCWAPVKLAALGEDSALRGALALALDRAGLI